MYLQLQRTPPPLIAVIVLLAVPASASAHEPIFGVGPHTLFENGVAAEVEGEFSGDEVAQVYEFAYGITPDLTATAQLPLVYRFEEGSDRFGLGDASLRLKWRFLRFDSPRAQDAVAVVAGVKLPTGPSGGDLPLGTGSTDVVGALTYGHEGRRWYWWADVRYAMTTVGDGINRGDVFFYDAAFGVRPWLLRYDEPDLVVLAEVNGRRFGAAERSGIEAPNTGGNIVTAGPAFFFTYRNYAIKGGVALPVWWSMNGTQPDPGIEGIVALEGHF